MSAKLLLKTSLFVSMCLFVGCSTNDASKSNLVEDNQAVVEGNYKFSLVHDGLTRTYEIYIPTNYKNNQATPVVIYLHGGKGNASSAYQDKLDIYAEKHGFILAIPEATGETVLGKLRGTWNGGNWGGASGNDNICCGSADDVGFISAMIEQLKIKYNIDSKRIYATGLSNGGLMANRLACDLSDKIAAIAVVAPGAVKTDCNTSRAVPYLHIHGMQDTCNDFYTGEATYWACSRTTYDRMHARSVVAQWKRQNVCSDTMSPGYQNGDATCYSYNNCQDGATVELCQVEAMGHTWPSGSQYLPVRSIGPVNYDISTDQIWAFFQKHSL